MSRGGGRGGGRGGRGGGRGGRPNVSWDTGEEPDARPSELFPPYLVPTPRDLTTEEIDGIQCFLLLRRQIHSSPLYTTKRTSVRDPTAPRKIYGQAQMNARFDVKNKASLDPFNAVPTYSQKFVPEERALPDWSKRPICRELFPPELLNTIDPDEGAVGAGRKKRRRLELSKVSALPNAEQAFGMPALDGEDEVGGRNLLERLDAMRDEEGEEGAEADEEEALEEEEDEAYDDEDAGDYDAENYFDNGDDLGEDMGDGDDGEGTF